MIAFSAACGGAGAADLPPAAERPVDFVKDVQPILSENCYTCHGPRKHEAEVRWDNKEIAMRGGDRGADIIPGHSADSRIVQTVSGVITNLVMPQSGDRLTAQQIGILRAWIDQGANWPDSASVKVLDPRQHWSFKAPVEPPIPAVKLKKWARNPIDDFILARLETEKLHPSPEADRPMLLRRLSLDLIGLPPTLEEIRTFVNDRSPDAYEKQVTRLLASPHFGECWARHWLDVARYADSNGYEKDLARTIWPYRDWVIDAYNCNLSYDQFVTDQIAGDMLTNSTLEDKVATGFFRNSMLNEEGGIDPEEFRNQGIIERMDVMGKAFLGLTLNCCQCHNHKYDPISQKEYYQFFAFLNNDEEPAMEIPDKAARAKRGEIEAEIAKLEDGAMAQFPDIPEKMEAWEKEMTSAEGSWTVLDPETFYASVGTKFTKLEDDSLLATGSNPGVSQYTVTARTMLKGITGFRLEALTDPNLPAYGPGRSGNGNFVLTEFTVEAGPIITNSTNTVTNQIALQNPTADFSQSGFPVAAAIDGIITNKTGWAVDDIAGRNNKSRRAVFEAKDSVGYDEGTIFRFTLNQSFGGENAIGRFRVAVTTSSRPLKADPLSKEARAILSIPRDKRTAAQQRELFSYYRHTDSRLDEVTKKIDEEQKKWPSAPETLVLLAREHPRQSHIFIRGDWQKEGAPVMPGVPAVLPPLPKDAPLTRLTLARWMVDKKNPTVARVEVNRVWHEIFGRGIVATVEDFGTQGDKPTNPELLDWLACDFMANGWDVKRLIREMVESATYRQSSFMTPEMVERDPDNRLLERGPRVRVDAEIIRDIALQAGGLLDEKVGGPPVFPPIPDGVMSLGYGAPMAWETKAADRHRRAMYTFVKRTVPYPSLQIFDSPTGESSCPRRVRSDTPLQALTTLNDPVFVEAAQAVALRAWKEGGHSDHDRVSYAFELCTGRKPTAKETATIESLLKEETGFFENRTARAVQVAALDIKNPPQDVNLEHVAAWTMVARVLLNLDETITKE